MRHISRKPDSSDEPVDLRWSRTRGALGDAVWRQVRSSRVAVNGQASLPRPASVTTGSIGRSYLRVDRGQLTRLLLSQFDWNSASGSEPSTRLARQVATALFPYRTLWRPVFDDLPSVGR